MVVAFVGQDRALQEGFELSAVWGLPRSSLLLADGDSPMDHHMIEMSPANALGLFRSSLFKYSLIC